MDWLADFVEYAKHGETPEKIMYWVGVATVAGALRRKVWIDQEIFQWTPNFYLLIVGPPGTIKKSTSIGVGMRLLKRVPGVNFGPQSVTWQQLITHMADLKEKVVIEGEEFLHSSITIDLSEFGSFFDTHDQKMIDALTDLWDSKIGSFSKETKTNGSDEIVNPWINILACTTPRWLSKNFSEDLIGSGFGSRPIYLYAAEPKSDLAYPRRSMPPVNEMRIKRSNLVRGLSEMAEYSGEYQITEEAYVWGEKWYADYRARQRSMGNSVEAGFNDRLQTHLHKLAMVLSASQGDFPTIDAHHLAEADARLRDLDGDVKQIFGFIGQSKSSGASREIVEILGRGWMRKRDLYKKHFFRIMSDNEFEEALNSTVAAGLVQISGAMDNLIVELR